MEKKIKHKAPMEYRIRYTVNDAAHTSTQYYNVFHSSEALEFLAHTWRKGHIHGGSLNILAVEEYNKYSLKWEDRLAFALEYASIPEMTVSEGGNAVFSE